MLAKLKRFFEDRSREASDQESIAKREHGLRLATAALLYEIVRADGEIRSEERAVMRAAISSALDLDQAEIDDLMRLAEEASLGAASLYEFTSLIDKDFTPEQKRRVVELLWLVAFADARKDAVEEHMIRKIAGLLHVSHPEFIDAKIRARSASAKAESAC
jgi:uncharacterized tellurite resistance protein B-like protein